MTSIRVDARPGECLRAQEQLPLSVYIAALGLQLSGTTVQLRGGEVALNVEPAKPRPGRGPKALGHYEHFNARYDELVRDGVKAPIRVIAEEYGVQEGTVKVWRWRARKYLREETSRQRLSHASGRPGARRSRSRAGSTRSPGVGFGRRARYGGAARCRARTDAALAGRRSGTRRPNPDGRRSRATSRSDGCPTRRHACGHRPTSAIAR